MVKTFFTADTHFGHWNICRYCERPFNSIVEHDEELICKWNRRVKPNDIVYHLGDFVWWRHPNPNFGKEILERLNGRVTFIRGNHDGSLEQMRKRYPNNPVHDYLEIDLPDDTSTQSNKMRHIVLCHYSFRTWNRAHHGAWHLFGHSHNGLKNDMGELMTDYHYGCLLDVGVDGHNYYPWNWEEIKEYMKTRDFRPTDHHSGKMNTTEMDNARAGGTH